MLFILVGGSLSDLCLLPSHQQTRAARMAYSDLEGLCLGICMNDV